MKVNPSNSYYQKTKKKLRKKTRETYQNLPEEEEKSSNTKMVTKNTETFLVLENKD